MASESQYPLIPPKHRQPPTGYYHDEMPDYVIPPYPMPEQHFYGDEPGMRAERTATGRPVRRPIRLRRIKKLPMPETSGDYSNSSHIISDQPMRSRIIEANVGGQEMSKRLEVPADLEHLIEKRDDEKDRRGEGRAPPARKSKWRSERPSRTPQKSTDEKASPEAELVVAAHALREFVVPPSLPNRSATSLIDSRLRYVVGALAIGNAATTASASCWRVAGTFITKSPCGRALR